MESVMREIERIREGRNFCVDLSNTNRYRVVASEEDGSKTAYYFAVPIYGKDRKLLDLKFHKGKENSYMIGSSCSITLADTILMENNESACRLYVSSGYMHGDDHCVLYDGMEVYPGTNGIACKAVVDKNGNFHFRLKTRKNFHDIKYNGKYFSFMSGKYNPFLTISCIGALGMDSEVVSPIHLTYHKMNDTEFEFCVYCDNTQAQWMLFEVNLYEPKLFQDTTVESKNPQENNAFGGTAFIGRTDAFGDQWLYARPDFSKMRDLIGKTIQKAILHIPTFNYGDARLSGYQLPVRFCSFGSNWERKKKYGGKFAESEKGLGYQKIDVTKVMVNNQKLFAQSEGLVFKNAKNNDGFAVISTGDSYYAPQIMEINFR